MKKPSTERRGLPPRPVGATADRGPWIDLTREPPAERPPIQFFSDVPKAHTQCLIDDLRAHDVPVRALYRHPPPDDEAGAGAGARIELGDDDLVTGSMRHERQQWRRAAGRHVVMAGPHESRFDATRRMAAGRRARTVHLWGEHLERDTLVTHGLRSHVGPWHLDGVLAVGTRAVDSYRAATGKDVPVHVLPYVTDRGLTLEADPASRPTIGFAGRLVPAKGLVLLLRALARLPGSERPRLQVAGAGPEEAALRVRAHRLGIDRWVEWLGPLTPAELDAVRARWWAQIVPSRRADRWGLSVHEALNTGVPVIASGHVHAATDLVRSGCNGLIVRGDDPERWALAIQRMMSDECRLACAAAARPIGRAFAPDHASHWLLELLAAADRARRGDGRRLPSRSFVEHAWTRLVPTDLREPVCP